MIMCSRTEKWNSMSLCSANKIIEGAALKSFAPSMILFAALHKDTLFYFSERLHLIKQMFYDKNNVILKFFSSFTLSAMFKNTFISFFWFKQAPDQGSEQRESNLTVLFLLIIIILISYIIIIYY
jgi:hypothetical protein